MIVFMNARHEYNRWPNCGYVGLVPQRTRGPVLANLLFVGPGLYPPERPASNGEDRFRVFDVDALSPRGYADPAGAGIFSLCEGSLPER
jgi:hypothetical protein